MRPNSVILLIALAGCSDSLSLEGNLLDTPAATEVRLAELSSPLESGEFRLEGVGDESAQLVFSGGEGGEGVMTIEGLPSSGQVRLSDVWIQNGLAFPMRIEAPDDGVLTINGLRMGGAARVDGDQEITGTVLALSQEDGTLFLRPTDASLPDVGVFLGTGTVLQTADGEPVEFGRLGFGDTLIVRGVGASGYVLSNAILSLRGGSSSAVDELPSAPIDSGPPAGAQNDNRDEGRGGDADNDRGKEDSGRGNRGRGRPAFTPGRRN